MTTLTTITHKHTFPDKNSGCENVIISDVISQTDTVNDNSDDDVIEVVRDEAPIEILSDGEEMELQKKSTPDKAIENFTFATVVQETVVEKDDKASNDVPEDPLVTTHKEENNVVTTEPVQAVPISIITHTSAIENSYKIDQTEQTVISSEPENKPPDDTKQSAEKDIDHLNDDMNTLLNVDGEDPIEGQMNALFGLNIGMSPEAEDIVPN